MRGDLGAAHGTRPGHHHVGLPVCRRPCRRRRPRRAPAGPAGVARPTPRPGRPCRSGAGCATTPPASRCARAHRCWPRSGGGRPGCRRRSSSPGPSCGGARRRREHLGPDRIARVHRAAGREEARSLRESHADAPGKAAEAAVRRAGDGVLLEEDDRNAPKTRRQDDSPPTRSRRRRPPVRAGDGESARVRSRRRVPGRSHPSRPRARRRPAPAGRGSGAASDPPRGPGAPRARSGCRRTRPTGPVRAARCRARARGRRARPSRHRRSGRRDGAIRSTRFARQSQQHPDLRQRHHHRRPAVRDER